MNLLKCKEVGDALEPWLEQHGARFAELSAKVTKFVGADAKNFGRVETRLGSVVGRCKDGGVRTPFMERDARIDAVAKMFPKTRMGFELR